jgi:hypothetical protein
MHFAFHSELTVVEPINQGSGIKLISVCLLRRIRVNLKKRAMCLVLEGFRAPVTT